jgi:hypothetical protein
MLIWLCTGLQRVLRSVMCTCNFALIPWALWIDLLTYALPQALLCLSRAQQQQQLQRIPLSLLVQLPLSSKPNTLV